MNNVLNALDAMLEAYRKKEREFPSYDELAGLLKAPAILVSADPAENEAIARDAQAIVDEEMATFPQGPREFPGGFRIPRPPEEVAAAAQSIVAAGVAPLVDGQVYLDAVDSTAWIQSIGRRERAAAAPQVVADERGLPPLPQYFPSIVNIRADEEVRAQQYAQDYARSALAAAPVQAQEPVAEVSAMPGTSGFTMAVFKADDMPIGSKVYRAPVQPVAMADDWKWMPIKATGTMADAGAFSGLPVGAAEPWIAKQVWEAMAAQSPAAPAAQGDAKDVFQHTGGKLYEKLGELKAKVGDTGWWNAVRYRALEDGQEYVTDSDRWHHSFTPIAAKAAS